jgi:hypothetical protein
MQFHSQACQDEFVVAVLGGKRNGWWLELGGNDPVQISNTYTLGWQGITVEKDTKWLPRYQEQRPRMHPIIADATTVDYSARLQFLSAPKQIDYLQIDLEPANRSPLTCLEILDRTVMDEYAFGVVTFEHDFYAGDYHDTRAASRAIFQRRGYTRLFSDVFCYNDKQPFEDWYVHHGVIDPFVIEAIMFNPQYKLVGGMQPRTCVELTKRHASVL